MRKNKSILIAHISLAFIGLMVAFLIFISSEARMVDGQLEFSESNAIEISFIMVTVLLVILSWVLGVLKAIKNGQGWWAVWIFLVWPLAYLYLLRVEPKSKMPARGANKPLEPTR
jgi:hypothetical protein